MPIWNMIYHVEQAHLELISNVQIQSCYPILNFDFYRYDAFQENNLRNWKKAIFNQKNWFNRESKDRLANGPTGSGALSWNNVIEMTHFKWVIKMTNNNHLNSRLPSNCKSKELPLLQSRLFSLFHFNFWINYTSLFY